MIHRIPPGTRDVLPAEMRDAAIALGQALLGEATGPPSRAGILDPSTWIEEGFRLAKSRIYTAPIKIDGSPSSTHAAYRRKASETGEKQLVLAGYRLANLLNSALQ